jgi:riboflavin kinase/FMN adenylyltransferase
MGTVIVFALAWCFVIRDMPDLALPALRGGAVVTVGTFDGIHLGHRDILAALAKRGHERSLPTVLITFQPHPLAVLNPPAAPRLLTPGAEQLEAVAGSPAPDYVVLVPFTRTLSTFSAERFVRELLITRFQMSSLVVGYDHGLGRGREGDADALARLGRKLGFSVDVVPERTENGGPISSTAIRRAVAYGDLPAAQAALGRSYSVAGTVERGANRGTGLGFPTINVAAHPDKLLPADGVYAVRAWSASGTFGGMLNLGGRPTFGDSTRSIEAHLFGASGDWYGRQVTVEFVSRLRDVIRFSGPDALVAQLERDVISAQAALTQA